MRKKRPIGIFDSGYGGLTVYKEIKKACPDYDFVYLGDNARVPYGIRSFETVYRFTWQCVKYLLDQGCPLVVVACNTASAKALRNVQQLNLVSNYADRRVLGVIRPTTEMIGTLTKTRHIGILATEGTVLSESYVLEVAKFYPDVHVHQLACPMWVPIIENGEHLSPGADYFVKKYIDVLLSKNGSIDTIVLACTHYPLLINKIKSILPSHINVISQGEIVASSLLSYLQRHESIDSQLTRHGSSEYLTTDSATIFSKMASIFVDEPLIAKHVFVD